MATRRATAARGRAAGDVVPPAARTLPGFVEPMLAVTGEPFDDDAFLFEIKWDGFRALAFTDGSGCYRLLGRRRSDFAPQFPELAEPLGTLPAGCVLDGEIVQVVDGKPDFAALLSRRRGGPRSRATRSATFVAFDLLFDRFEDVCASPCVERRERLREIVAAAKSSVVVMSEGVVGQGIAYFGQASAAGLEGVVAKRLSSTYQAGRRSDDWVKIKRSGSLVCAIVGWEHSVERGPGVIRSLVIATLVDGELRCVGQVGSGIDEAAQALLLSKLAERTRPTPVVPATIEALGKSKPELRRFRWVEPGLFCRVNYLEWSKTGKLRGPAFDGLIEP
jgi:DNA ligase D-like protein (predicted ligase)